MERSLSRREASDAVTEHGWRFVLGTLRTSVPVGSLARAAAVASRAVELCGADADDHLRADLRPDRVLLSLRTTSAGALTARDVDLALRLSEAVREAGLRTEPGPVQLLEIAIDALDIAKVRPFWKAVLAYTDQGSPDGPLADPAGRGPAVWFQQMDLPRPQRNRIHLDISVPHDEAPRRVEAALAAGGRLVSGDRAPAFWVLADPEDNEACVSTWQGRDG